MLCPLQHYNKNKQIINMTIIIIIII